MKKLPIIILLAVFSGLHLTACADDDAAKQQAQAAAILAESKQADTTAEAKPAEGEQAADADAKPAEGEQAADADTKPAEGEQAAAPAEEAKPAEGGEKKAGGGDEPDCN